MLDRGFKNDMQSLPIICSHCNWTDILKNYQEHLDHSHGNPKCNYCDEQFISVNQLNQHKTFQCRKITVECLLKHFGCHQQILRCELTNHYQSKQHQDSLLNVINQMKLQLRNAQMTSNQMDTDSPRTTTMIDDNFAINQLEELHESINILTNGSEALNEDAQRLNTEALDYQDKLQHLTETVSNLKVAVEEEHGFDEAIVRNLEVLNQDLVSLQEKIDNMQHVSYDGTFVWKITKLQEKFADAQSERQPSIYSLPFYSSPIGYKMRARLYLNGDGNARRTHMSLFFVLMRGRNDAILKFPFNYKVTFCLYDQTPNQRHIIDSFRPDIRSSSFQRPRSEMNIASGIPKFFPLSMIQQEGNPYVRDDTMFIKVMIDFGGMPKTLLPYALSLNPGLPTNVQQYIIKQEIERRAQPQTLEQHLTTNQ
ncbi:unnamed protein product [Rotaria sp. Silwood1]|nr:unnamed protein product [Rotaria sp. Silwood1]CAF4531899.1 unnamed protein product [Rotaria sp. Silwood1]